jgi:hypothetical protein
MAIASVFNQRSNVPNLLENLFHFFRILHPIDLVLEFSFSNSQLPNPLNVPHSNDYDYSIVSIN